MLFALRILLVALWIVLTAIVGIFISLFSPFNPQNSKRASHLFKWGTHILGVEMKIRHREILEENRPCIFLSNHQDNFDIFVGAFSIPDRTVSMGKRSILFIPVFGLFYWLSGNILIDRKNKRSAFGTMDEVGKAMHEKNLSVWIMPEGTRSRGRGLLPFKKGPFLTAIKAGVPIVPVAVSSYAGKLRLNRWRAGTILIEALPPLSTQGLTTDDASELKERAFLQIKEGVAKLDRELAANSTSQNSCCGS